MIRSNPFFILANPRSGSSLLRIICESHSNITVPPESGFMEWWYSKYKNWDRDHSKDPEMVNDFINDLLSSKKIETWKLIENEVQSSIQYDLPASYSELIELIYLLYAMKRDKEIEIWGDNNNYYINKTDLIDTLYPEAKYIHLIRDGRDVAVSYSELKNLITESKYRPNLTKELNEIATEWDKNNEMIGSFLRRIPKERYIVLKFEDLINDLKNTCKSLTSFLNVSFDSKMLEYYVINQAEHLEPVETLDWKTKTLEKPDRSNIGKYKEYFTDEEIRQFNDIAHNSLRKFEYEI